MHFELVRQHDFKDCGAACLSMICRHYKLRLPMAKFRDYIKVDNCGASIYGLVDGAKQVGLCATALQGNADELLAGLRNKEFVLPLIARVIIDETLEHFVVIYKITDRAVFVADPAKGKKKYRYLDFFAIWTGQIVVFEKTDDFRPANEDRQALTKFIPLIVSQKKLLAAVFVCSLFITAISILGAFLFQLIVDNLQSDAAADFYRLFFSKICIGVLVLYLFQALIAILRGWFLARLCKKVDIPLLLNYCKHVVDLPLRRTADRKTGELTSRFYDAENIRDALSSTTLSLLLDTLMVVVCVVILHALNNKLFFVALFTVLAYAAVVLLFVNPMKRVNEALMEKNAEVTSYLKESFDGLETVKAFGAEQPVKERISDKVEKYISESVRGGILYTVQNSLSGFMASTGILLLLWYGTKLLLRSEITLGTLITFYSLLGYFLDPIQRLVNLQPQIQSAIIAAERLNDILDLNAEPECDNPSLPEKSINVSHVNFRYGNRELVLNDISLHIKSGETVALVGESGSGKTTLAKLLMAFYSPESGAIMIGSQNIAFLNPKAVRQSIAYISQDVFLFSDTIRNNLTLGNQDVATEEIENACRISGADEFIQKLPMGYNTLIGENGNDLSGGQKQRLAIARALLKKPKILIMDEATSNLDTISEQNIKKAIRRIRGDITCIIIAHRFSTVIDCDTIYVMKNGTIAESGNHASLLAQNGLYKELYEEMR